MLYYTCGGLSWLLIDLGRPSPQLVAPFSSQGFFKLRKSREIKFGIGRQTSEQANMHGCMHAFLSSLNYEYDVTGCLKH